MVTVPFDKAENCKTTLCKSAHGHSELSAAPGIPPGCPPRQLPPARPLGAAPLLAFLPQAVGCFAPLLSGPRAVNAGSGLVRCAQGSDIHPACVFAGDAGAVHPQVAMLEVEP